MTMDTPASGQDQLWAGEVATKEVQAEVARRYLIKQMRDLEAQLEVLKSILSPNLSCSKYV